MNSLALKIAVFVSMITLSFGSLAALFRLATFSFVLVTACVVFAAVFLAMRRSVLVRLRRINAAFDELRQEAGRAAAGRDDGGDEIDVLSRKSDRALHSVRKRFAELNQADDYRRDYIGDVSHELKTPIFAIHGFAETLLDGALDDVEVSRGFVKKILQNAARLTGLVRDLSEISRLERSSVAVAPERLSLIQIAMEVKGSLELIAAAERVEMHIEIPAEAEMVEADRDKIRQVLSNLSENAIKYNRPGGWVRISAERSGERVAVYVRDNGIGIAPADIPRVTERFFRAEKSRSRPHGGSGLGLSIVKHILAAHGSTLKIESELERGSSFSFMLRAA